MLSTSVLVLNRLYQPVHVTSVRRALILLYRGAAKAVDEQYQTFDFESWAELAAVVHEESIGTTRKRIRVPRVVLFPALRPPPGGARPLQPPQHLRAGPEPLPVLRQEAGA